jgi:metal-responsive CopG/Arc/MetJ family transcriptional regulator
LRAKYTTVKIPQELALKLDSYVADLGYRSRAEIVNDAIRRFIDERKRLGATSPQEVGMTKEIQQDSKSRRAILNSLK